MRVLSPRLLRRVSRSASFLVAALASSLLGAAAFVGACASDSSDDAPADGGSEASLLGDAVPPDADADVPLGEICGDSQGIEKGAPWPMRGGCPKRAGASTSTGPQGARLEWSVEFPVGESSPAIGADGIVWVGTSAGDIVALSPSGNVVGVLRTGGAIASSPARSATHLTIFGSADGKLYGVEPIAPKLDAGADADAGASDAGEDEAGAFPSARLVFAQGIAPIKSSPAIGGDGTIYVGTTDGRLAAVNRDGSMTQWATPTGDTGGSSPALALGGTIYIGSTDKKLYAFTKAGIVAWTFETGGAVGSPVVGGDDTIYVGSSDGKLYAVSPDGKLRWSYSTGGPISGAPCVRGGLVYVGSDDKKLHAVLTTTGTKKWSYETLGAVATPVVGSDGTVYVGSTDGNLYAITPTGLLYFAVNTKAAIRSAPALGDNGVLYVSTEKAVVAIGP